MVESGIKDKGEDFSNRGSQPLCSRVTWIGKKPTRIPTGQLTKILNKAEGLVETRMMAIGCMCRGLLVNILTGHGKCLRKVEKM